ncbi:sigma factor-like helix-turn-helix DNA-binding protein [Rhizobium sp.]|uniref:sigma factor-like helix-turn-helix DNA-binding protein n=1 Tax=Rhizobium sp. TaxID=391 RepID=UPI003F7D2057
MREDIWINRASALECFDGKGLSAQEVSKKSGLNLLTVRRYANKFGFDFGGNAPALNGDERYREKLNELRRCADEGMKRFEAAEKLGISKHTVYELSRQHGIEFVHGSVLTPSEDPRAEAMAAIYKGGKTLAEIGDLYGISRERVRQILAKRGNVSAKDGGQSVRSKRNKASAAIARDRACLEQYGCTHAQYQELVRIGAAQKKVGQKTHNTTPTGAYSSQKRNSIRRGIDWNISLWEWWSVWVESGKWEQRGRSRGAYVMCRYGDVGAYEIGNVYIASVIHNVSFQPNNPHRKDHPNHAEAISKKRHRHTSLADGAYKRKNFDLPLGVTRQKGRFLAQICIDGRTKYLGSFSTPEEAKAAYEAKRSELLTELESAA